jgi:hypothetical protein
MTQDEIIEMAKQVWLSDYGVQTICRGSEVEMDLETLQSFAKLVAEKEREEFAVHAVDIARRAIAEEREACAKLCDSTIEQTYISGYTGAVHSGRRECAELIRARGQA